MKAPNKYKIYSLTIGNAKFMHEIIDQNELTYGFQSVPTLKNEDNMFLNLYMDSYKIMQFNFYDINEIELVSWEDSVMNDVKTIKIDNRMSVGTNVCKIRTLFGEYGLEENRNSKRKLF